MIERKIVTGMIVSTDYLRGIRRYWSPKLIKSNAARKVAQWCVEYFDEQNKAPGKDIELIYITKLKAGKIQSDLAEELEEDILPGLSEEYDPAHFNVDYLFQKTKEYFKLQQLELHAKQIQAYLLDGDLMEAETLAYNYVPEVKETGSDLDLSDVLVLDKIQQAFEVDSKPVVRFTRALGEMWNRQMVRDSLVAFQAPEKRGKTFLLMEVAIRAHKQGAKAAFFSAGDMSEGQLLRRVGSYLTKRSLDKLPDKLRFTPVRDCKRNQMGLCKRHERESNGYIFTEDEVTDMKGGLRKGISLGLLIEKFEEFPDHVPCHNCDEYYATASGAGTPWLKKINPRILTYQSAQAAVDKFFIKNRRMFKLSTHPNDTLSVSGIKSQLALWEKQDGFVPDLIVVDYADLLVTEGVMEHRHQQNKIWKQLRGLSQEQHALVLTATQADADSYGRDRQSLKNFSEDKRKYGHVTAMYGLNQDPEGREKRLGILRINELVVRDKEFYPTREVTVLQNLNIGQPYLTSYW